MAHTKSRDRAAKVIFDCATGGAPPAAQRERPPDPKAPAAALPRDQLRVTGDAGSVLRSPGRRPHLRAHALVDGEGSGEDL